MKLRYLRINMVPGTGLYSSYVEDAASAQAEDGAGKIEHNKVDSLDIGTIAIDVHGTVFSGTLLQRGNRSLTIDKP